MLQLKNQSSGSKIVWSFSINLNWKELWCFKVKESILCLNKKKTLIESKRKRKRKMPHKLLERRTLCFSSYKNRELKVKRWVGAHERKKVPFILPQGIFFKFFFRLYILLHTKKHYLICFCCLFWIRQKPSDSFKCPVKTEH